MVIWVLTICLNYWSIIETDISLIKYASDDVSFELRGYVCRPVWVNSYLHAWPHASSFLYSPACHWHETTESIFNMIAPPPEHWKSYLVIILPQVFVSFPILVSFRNQLLVLNSCRGTDCHETTVNPVSTQSVLSQLFFMGVVLSAVLFQFHPLERT